MLALAYLVAVVLPLVVTLLVVALRIVHWAALRRRPAAEVIELPRARARAQPRTIRYM